MYKYLSSFIPKVKFMDEEISVLHLTWEWPPRIIGGIATHTYNLCRSLKKLGINVYVITCDFPRSPSYEKVYGVEVFRVDSYSYPSPDFLSWICLMNWNFQQVAIDVIKRIKTANLLLHAHDWLVASSAIALKHMFRIPLIATIHSTELGRRGNLHSSESLMIHQCEWWLSYEAWKVLCCSQYMASRVIHDLGVPPDKVRIIRNGVRIEDFDLDFDKASFRRKYALPDEKIILFVGRLVYEKGAHLLIQALPKVLSRVNAKLIIVGEGYMKDDLLHLARSLGIYHKVYVTGFLDTVELRKLYRCADVCVFPSLYEPFGLVALEAMAARSPVIVSDVGGFNEIVEDRRTGIKVRPDVDSIADSIIEILSNPQIAEMLVSNAYEEVKKNYSWDGIARSVKEIYEEVLAEYRRSNWHALRSF